MITTRPWHGIVAKLNTPAVDNHVLVLGPDVPLRHRDLPLPLIVALSSVEHTCGTVTRLRETPNSVYASGDIEVDSATNWGHTLLTGGHLPVNVGVQVGRSAMDVDGNASWWQIEHEPEIPHPPITEIQLWAIANVNVQQYPGWPGVFIRLRGEHDRSSNV